MKSKSRSMAACILLSVLAVSFLLGGCQTQQTQDPTTIKIGLIAPLTGDAKTYGESVKNAFQLALEKRNNTAGGFKIETVVADDRNDPTEGVNVATKLISQDKVQAIVGPVTTPPTIAASEVINGKKVIMITPTATAAKVTVDSGTRKEYVFRACFIDPLQARVGAKFALENLEAQTAAILYDQGNDYSKGLAEVFRTHFEEGGGQVVAWEAYAKTDSDFSAQLTDIATKNPDVLYLPDYYEKASIIGRQARDKGITADFLGPDGWDSSDLDYEAMDGGYFTNHYSPDSTEEVVQQWIADYKAKYGTAPDALGSLAFDATNLLLDAIDASKSTEPAKIKDALAAIEGFKGVTGTIAFDENGNPVKSVVVLQVKDGGQTYVATINP